MKKDDCHVEPVEKPVDEETLARADVAALFVNGMGCVNCANRVRNGLLRRGGVYQANVDLSSGVARVQFDASVVGVEDLLSAVAKAGSASQHVYRAQLLGGAEVG